MRVLIAPFGSHGDVHPLLGLGDALRSRGHEVIYIIAANFAPLIEKLGFRVVAIGDSTIFDQTVRNPDLWHPRRAFPLVAEGVLMCTRLVYEAIESLHLPGETVAIAGTLAFGVRIAGERLGIPTATVHLQPSIIHSNIKVPVYPGLRVPGWWPIWLRKALFETVYGKVLDPHLMPGLNAFRSELGLPPVRRVMMRWIHESPLVLGFFPAWYGPPQADWPPNVELVGFPLYDERDATPLPEHLERFLEAGDPPIAFTPGSANVHGESFFIAARDACVQLGRRGLLLTRYPEQIPAELPDSVIHVPFAPFGLLLPRVAALVHHGGVGTAAQAMAAGVPQLIMALAHDQFDNADRLTQLGVGRLIPSKRLTGNRLANELRGLIDSPQVIAAARAVAARFPEEPPPMVRASELIEQLLREWPTRQASASVSTSVSAR